MFPFHRQLTIQIPGLPPLSPGGYSPFQPPFGPPGYNQGDFGGGFGTYPGQFGPPSGPPPTTIPPDQSTGQYGIYAVDPGAIRGCLYRFTYVRLNNGRAFWYFPIFVGRTSVAGWRWRRNQYRWDYFGIDLTQIRSFSCR